MVMVIPPTSRSYYHQIIISCLDYNAPLLGIMFGASVVRQKRERERRDRLSRDTDPPVIPYIKPFGVRFDPEQLPYFKYRQAIAQMEDEKVLREVG